MNSSKCATVLGMKMLGLGDISQAKLPKPQNGKKRPPEYEGKGDLRRKTKLSYLARVGGENHLCIGRGRPKGTFSSWT